MAAMLWDIFCRVIDNFGDIGVCWRLSADLCARGHQVRLWIDDASALNWMAPLPRAVEVLDWQQAERSPPPPGDVVVEAFGCHLPETFVAGMQRAQPPTWINLEYLSAEDYVERSHRLQSPVWNGAGAGLKKWFFYPGFTQRTGGLLREPGLLARRDAFQQDAQARVNWLRNLGVSGPALLSDSNQGHRLVSVFCYDSAPLATWLNQLAQVAPLGDHKGTTLLLTPGPATRLARQWASERGGCPDHLLLHELPHLSQVEFDYLLWSCDLNLVRGEDSAVRALWAGRPHIWQIYEQDDGVHADKLKAFMQQWMANWRPELTQKVASAWRTWNLLSSDSAPLSDLWSMAHSQSGWLKACQESGQKLARQGDLTTQLLEFALEFGTHPG